MMGKWIVGNKNRWGFIIQICGSAGWIYVALYPPERRVWGLLAVTVGCVCANVRNWRKWGKEE